MGDVRRICRLAGLAAGLGIAAAFTPGIASADDFQVSIDGMDLFPATGNTAVAESGMGDLAIAFGDNSFACAGCSALPGMWDLAVADGANNTADSGFGQFDAAMTTGSDSLSNAAFGNFDTAIASGVAALADASGASPDALGNHDVADAWGSLTLAKAGDIDSLSPASNDVAWVLDPFSKMGSDAFAGDGNADVAGVFGGGLTASALGNFMYDIVSALFNFHN